MEEVVNSTVFGGAFIDQICISYTPVNRLLLAGTGYPTQHTLVYSYIYLHNSNMNWRLRCSYEAYCHQTLTSQVDDQENVYTQLRE